MSQEENSTTENQQSQKDDFEYQTPVKLNALMEWGFLGFAGLILCLFVSHLLIKNIMIFAIGLVTVSLIALISLSVASFKMWKDYKNQKADWESKTRLS